MPETTAIADMTCTDVEQAAKDRPVAFLPVGTTEAHGPHLPLSTDVVIASEMARRGAVRLKGRGIPALLLPPLAYAISDMGAEFPGTLGIGPETLVALVRDVCVSATKRFRAVALVNVHMEPAQIETLRRATDEANKAGANVCFPDLTKKRWSERLGASFAAGDHGGSFETSLMMAAARSLIDEKARISLPPMDGLAAALKKGAKTFAEAGGEDAYFGDPTAASVEEGETLFGALAEVLTVAVMEHLGSKG